MTVYAQARRDGYVAVPAQVGSGECGADPSGHYGPLGMGGSVLLECVAEPSPLDGEVRPSPSLDER